VSPVSAKNTLWSGVQRPGSVVAAASVGVVKDQNGEPERGSEWEPIKVLFKNSAYEPDFTRAPPQASLARFTQPLKCY
jgi:hypothetical protein